MAAVYPPFSPPSYATSFPHSSDSSLPPPSYSSGRRRRLSTPYAFHPTTTRRQSVEHILLPSPPISSSTNWAKCRLQSFAKSPSSRSTTHVTPAYRPGDELLGFVDLNLQKERFIQSISASITGTLSTGSSTVDAFRTPDFVPTTMSLPLGATGKVRGSRALLEVHSTLWKPSMGDPRALPPPSACESRRTHKRTKSSTVESTQKLMGGYTFPFLFTLPTTLPPSFTTEGGVSITYMLNITIQTPLFKQDLVITTSFTITPHTVPSFPSPSREMIYTCRSTLPPPGPGEDPEGWSIHPLANGYSLALANPQSYTRGTFVPLLLSSSSSAVRSKITLHQTVRFPKSSSPFTTEISTALPIPSRNSRDSHDGWTEFEIPLSKDLPPSYKGNDVDISYSIRIEGFRREVRVDVTSSLAGPGLKPVSRLK